MKSITSKRIALLVAVFVIGFIAVITVSAIVSSNYLITETEEKLARSTEKEANRINDWIVTQMDFMDSLAIYYHYLGDYSFEGLTNYFGTHLKDHPSYLELYIGFPDGTAIAGSGYIFDYSVFTSYLRPWYIGAANNPRSAYVSPIYVDAQTGKLCITFAKAVTSSGGELIGVMGADLLLDQLEEIIVQTSIARESQLFLTDASGDILVHQDRKYAPTTTTFQNINIIENGVYKAVTNLRGFDGESLRIRSAEGVSRFTIMRTIPAASWRLYAAVPDSVINTGTRSLLLIVIPLAVLVTLISLIISVFVTRSTDRMLRDASSRLHVATESIFSASHNLADSSKSLADSNLQQAASIEETSATMSQTSHMIHQTNENTRDVLTLTQQTSYSADAGIGVVNDLSDFITKLSNSSQDIAQIVDTIKSIAMQTTILALNASIEAARAGDAGRAFSIVADEVRSLASQADEAVKNITEIIGANIELTQFSSEGSAKVHESFNSIADQVHQIELLVKDIAVASEDQAHGITQINMAISQMEASTQSGASISQESADAARDLQDQADELRELSSIIEHFAGTTSEEEGQEVIGEIHHTQQPPRQTHGTLRPGAGIKRLSSGK